MTRISKAFARKLYNEGKQIALCACNLNPSMFAVSCGKEDMGDFESLCNAFAYYNCATSETGRHIAFYSI